jgi:RHS repeat-associated protein
MKGKPYRTRVNGIVGNQQKKYSEITTEYIAKTLTPYVFTPPLQINSYIYDGETGYKRSRTVYAFDPTNGNLTHEYQYGDYSDATDDRTIVKTYFPETSKWLVGLPTSETIYKGIGESTQEAKIDYYYDEATNDWCPESTNPTTAKGNLTSTVSWLKDLPSPTVKRAYDNYGNLRCIKDANGNISKISYDSSFTFPKISTNPMGQQTIIQYYGVDYMPTDTGLYGQVKSVTDPNGVTIDKEYDNFGRITKITDPYSRPGAYPYNTQSATYGTVSYQYNNFGTVGQQNITKIMTEKVDSITGLSCPASWWYNSTTNNCQKTQCYSSGWGGTTCYQLFSPPVCTGGYLDGNIDACRTPINIWDEEYFDGFGRTYKTRKKGPDGKVIVADTKYDGRGAVSQLSLPYFEGTALSDQLNQTFVYDPLGRITQVTNTDNTVAKSCYNKDITVLIDENNHRKRQTRDAFGHLIKVEEYKGVYPTCTTDVGTLYATTTYQYDVLGNLRFVTDAMGNQTEMRYDTLGRKTFMHDPDMGDWFYTYYNNGDLKTQTDANLKTTTFVYDALNRLKTKDYPTGTDVIYTYDEATSSNPIGRLTTMSDESGTTKYNYDKLGRTQKIEKTVDGWAYPLEFTYDLIGRVTSLKYPDGEIMSYGYDTGGNLNQAIGYFTYSGFNALGQPDTLTFGNGTITKYAYSPTNFRLSSIKTTTPKQTPLLIDLAYLYYDNGNIKTITNNLASTKTQTFTYDELDRIKSAQSTAYGTKSFDYDQIGNFTNKEGVTFTPKSGLAHRINCISTGRCYSYDFNGNTINDGVRSISYTYDNMPRTINSSINFTYDGNGTRTKKVRTTSPVTTTVYIDKLFECVNGACAKYIFAGDDRIALKSATKILSYHQDHLGSTASVTDAFGYKVDDISYNPFGTLQAETGSEPVNHKFTGQELDSETGLYNYNARLYDQVVGRFVTADTIIPDPANPQSLNRYSYVLNNPINLVDPTGNSSIDFELNYSGGYNDPWANYTLPSRDSIGPPPSQMGASPSSANMNSNGWYSGAINYLEGRAVSNLDSGNNVAAFIDTLGITAIDTLLPQSAYEVPLLFMGGVGKAGYNAAKRMGTLSNIEARLYYNSKLPVLSKAIERWKGQGLALQTVSEKASSLRNTLKLRTRNLMVDQATAQSLPPIRSYQYYLDKYTAEGLSGDALYNRIIKGTLTPNPGVNANFGIW